MTVSMTDRSPKIEVITSVQRRRRWSGPDKMRMVEETYEPGATVSLVARRHGVAPNQLFTWRRLAVSVGADHKSVQRWHGQAVDMVVRGLAQRG